jgi:hypothetical protein
MRLHSLSSPQMILQLASIHWPRSDDMIATVGFESRWCGGTKEGSVSLIDCELFNLLVS